MSILAAVADLVLPARCVGCGVGGVALCPACVPRRADARTVALARDLAVRAASPYDGAVRGALLAYKERGRADLRRPLARMLATAIDAAVQTAGAPAGLVLVPVPSSTRAVRARGDDPLARLTRAAGRRAGIRTAAGALVVNRRVLDSAGLGRAERAHNVRGAFRGFAAPAGRAALLVDDIVTTGATLREADRALRAAGWAVHGAAVVAATPRVSVNPLAAHSAAV